MKRLNISWTALMALLMALLLALFIFTLNINRSLVGGCRDFTLAETVEQLSSPVIQGVMLGRLVSTLLMALTAACLYRFVADLLPSRQAAWIMPVAAIVTMPLAYAGWTVYIGVLTLLMTASFLYVWRIARGQASGPVLLNYLGIAIALTVVWNRAWLWLLLCGIYIALFSKKRQLRVTAWGLGIAGVATAFIYRQQGLEQATLYGENIYKTLAPMTPLVVVILWGIALAGLVVWWLDKSKRGQAFFLLAASVTTAFACLVRSWEWNFIILPAFLTPAAVGVTLSFVILSARTRLMAAVIGVLLLLAPRPIGFPDTVDAWRSLNQHYMPDLPVVLDFRNDYASLAYARDVVSQYCTPPVSSLYVVLSASHIVLVQPSGNITGVSPEAIRGLPGLLLITPDNQIDPELVKGQSLILKEAPSGLVIYFYYQPDPTVLHQIDKLVIHSFDVRDAQTLEKTTPFKAGTELVISSWWSSTGPVSNDFFVSYELFDQQKRIGVSTFGSLTGIPTTQWKPNTFRYDRQRISLPPALEPGEYKLVMTVSTNDPAVTQSLDGNPSVLLTAVKVAGKTDPPGN